MRSDQPVKLSLIIPAFRDAEALEACLAHVRRSHRHPYECIVVNDGGGPEIAAAAHAAGAEVVSLDGCHGPAFARNTGAQAASGDILLFVDSDVCIRPDTVARFLEHFEKAPGVSAVFGSYDDSPGDPGMVSQYKNLLHHFVHQTGRPGAWTFWSGCGAIRREVLFAAGGFDASYRRPSIEDIELGSRLSAAGYRIVLDRSIQVAHLKRWTFWQLVRTDLFDRAIPWTRLILRTKQMPDDLNLHRTQRLSVALAYLGLVLAAAHGAIGGWAAGAAVCGAAIAVLNYRFYSFLREKRGVLFALRVFPLQFLYFLYCGAGFMIGMAVAQMPVARVPVPATPPLREPVLADAPARRGLKPAISD